MLYHLLVPLSDEFQFFNLFRYITFRTGCAVLTALIVCFIIAPPMIRWLKSVQEGSLTKREYLPDTHLAKVGTPTMGGLMILISVLFSTLLWADLTNVYIWYAILVMGGYGLIGFVDDFLKLTKKNSAGLSGKIRLSGEIAFALVASIGIHNALPEELNNHLTIPFFKDVVLPLSVFFFPWAVMVMVGACNAVNLTDGLDGLAIVPVAIAAGCFGLISYIVGNEIYTEYLQLPYVPGTGELAILCGALIGASMGFLWFNAPPAAVFMGDTGSLAMGGLLGAIAIMTKHEIVLSIVGGLFVLETLSVIIQVASYKMTGKRVFAMAPIHHHFEKKGWSEPTIVIRFWIISVILALIGLSTLKLR